MAVRCSTTPSKPCAAVATDVIVVAPPDVEPPMPDGVRLVAR